MRILIATSIFVYGLIPALALAHEPDQASDTGKSNDWINPIQKDIAAGNCDQAIEDLVKAAFGAGKPYADAWMGKLAEKGTCLPKDAKIAYGWYESAVREGREDFQMRLGMMDFRGKGAAKNVKRGQRRIRAALLRYPFASYSMARFLLIEGSIDEDEMPLEISREFAWLQNLKEEGDVPTLLGLVKRLMTGDGVPKDLNAAIEWLYHPPLKDVPEADYLRGKIRAQLKSFNDKSDSSSSFLDFENAAESGHQKAQSLLARLYAGMQPTKASLREALIWSTLANGPGDRSLQAEMTELLDPEDLVMVEMEIRERRQKYK